MRLAWWIGHSGTSAVIAEQFGTAMMPLCSRMRSALISGITSGTFGSMRKAEELSITTAPALTADRARTSAICRCRPRTARYRRPRTSCSVSSSITIRSPRKSMVLPADRALASALSLPTGKARLSMVAMNSAPTAPVTPAMATTGSLLTGLSPGSSMNAAGNKKAPVLFRRGFGLDDAVVRLRAHGSRAPGGGFGFRGAFGRSRHGADLCGRPSPPSTGFRLNPGCNGGRRAPLSPRSRAGRLEDHFLEVVAAHDDDREIQPAVFADQAAADRLARRSMLGHANGVYQALPDRLEYSEVAAVLGIELASGAGRLRRRRSRRSWRRRRAARSGRCAGSSRGRPVKAARRRS